MTNVGIVPMSAKPYHTGHDLLIRTASKQNDIVYVYASLSDRGVISGRAMKFVWEEMIIPNLPTNVIVSFERPTPIRNAWELLRDHENNHENKVFNLYSDPEDIETNFPNRLLIKYVPKLFATNLVKKIPISREITSNVSGTQMRNYLSLGDKKSFFKGLPNFMDKQRVWDLLTANF